MPHRVTLHVDAIPMAEQVIPSTFFDGNDNSLRRFDVQLDATEVAIKGDFLRESTHVVVTVEKIPAE